MWQGNIAVGAVVAAYSCSGVHYIVHGGQGGRLHLLLVLILLLLLKVVNRQLLLVVLRRIIAEV